MRTFSNDEVCTWLAGVGHLAAAVASGTALPDLLDLISATACELTGYEAAGVLLVDDDRRRLVFSGSAGLSPDYIAEVNEHRTIALASGPLAGGPSTKAFTSGAPVIIGDVLADESFAPWANPAHEHGYRAIASVPLLIAGESVGTLNCYRTRVHDFGPEEIGLLWALANQAGTALQSTRLIASLTHERRLAEQSERIHREFTGVALRAGGVQGVVDALARLLRRPVLLTDVSGPAIANAAHHGVQLTAERGGSDGPDRGPVDVPELGRVSAAVRLGSEPVAHIWTTGSLAELAELDVRAIEHAAVVCALELLRQRTAVDVEWSLRSDLLTDLLADGPTDQLRARAAALGHDLDRPHTVLVGAVDDPGATASGIPRALLTTVRDVAARCEPKPLVTSIEGDVIALWPTGDKGLDAAAAAAQIGRSYRRTGGTVTVVVGRPFETMAELRTRVGTGRGALRVAVMHGTDRVIAIPELGVYGLLVQLNDPAEVVRFAAHTLGPLRDYDRRRGADLLNTVRTYLDHGMSITRTAAALYLHQNTIGLRLKKVEELTGVSTQDPEGWLRLKIALMVDDVFGGVSEELPR